MVVWTSLVLYTVEVLQYALCWSCPRVFIGTLVAMVIVGTMCAGVLYWDHSSAWGSRELL